MICGNTAGSGPSMFANYRFVQPHTSRNVRIVGLSYLWAGLLGPVYVLFKSGPRELPHSIVLSLACAAVFIAFVIKGLAYVPETLQIVSLIFLLPIVFIFHSVKTIGLVRASFLQRNWMSRPAY
jgi:phosphate/sulfate permease